MPEGRDDVYAFLKRIFLFDGLSEARFEQLTDEFEVIRLVEGEQVYSPGEEAKYFYLVWEGRIHLTLGKGKLKQELGTLIPGDFFGEDLLFKRNRDEMAFALERSSVLRLEKTLLTGLLRDYPRVEERLIATANSRRLARQVKFRWLGDNEAIYLVKRRHEFFLYIRLIFPILLAVAAIPIIVWGFAPVDPAMGVVIFGFLVGLAAVLWGIWFYLDWENDYYIVTNQRVIWLEKIILLYESRQEAPLSAILSTNVVFNQVLRMVINYGTVIVRTYTGSIPLQRSEDPDLIIDFIKGQQSRARELAKQAEDRAMEALLRRRLGLEPRSKAPPKPVTQALPPPIPTRQAGFFENFLRVRYQVGDVITYRKHWLVLLQKTWLPDLIFIVLVFVLISGWFGGFGAMGLLFWGLLFIANLLWWLYLYVDWRNDVYVVTRENLLDIERKPLSREVKKTAPLGNILSLENRREGILGVLLNIGTVVIKVGSEQLDFDGVYNPAQVQYEIFDRMLALRRRKEEAEAARERERLADWLLLYHEQSELLEKIENNSDENRFSG